MAAMVCFKKLAAMPAMWSPWAPCSQEIITQKSWLGQSWDGLGRMGGCGVASGKRLHNYWKSPFSMGKSTINGIFNSYVKLPDVELGRTVILTLWVRKFESRRVAKKVRLEILELERERRHLQRELAVVSKGYRNVSVEAQTETWHAKSFQVDLERCARCCRCTVACHPTLDDCPRGILIFICNIYSKFKVDGAESWVAPSM